MAVAAEQGLPVWAVVVVVVVVVQVGALRAQTPGNEELCVGSTWFEIDAAGHWRHPDTVPPEASTTPHPPAMTHIPWDDVRKAAEDLVPELGPGIPLHMFTCSTSLSACPATGSSPETHCIRIARRGFCVAVDGACQALVVSVVEPTQCCCDEEEGSKLVGNITNVTLWDKASNGACVPLVNAQDPSVCCCGYEENKAMNTVNVEVKQRNMCTLPFDGSSGLGEEKDGGQSDGDNSVLNELTEKQSEKESIAEEIHRGDCFLSKSTEVQTTEEEVTTQSEVDDGGLSELTERHLKEDSVLEDIIAACVFLFVGAALLLIKSRLFQFTKKKRQQEDKDMESQETLVDETGI